MVSSHHPGAGRPWVLTVTRVQGVQQDVQKGGFERLGQSIYERLQAPAGVELPLTVPEVAALVWTWTPSGEFVLDWSRWRRMHQAIAKFYHHQRRRFTTSLNLQL